MFELLSIDQSATIEVLLVLAGFLTVVYICFRIVSWLIAQIAILVKWTMRGIVAAALSRFLWEWVSTKLNFSETVRSFLF